MYSVRRNIQVRYSETDQMGVVHHANYLIWFELGRTELIESVGLSYAAMEKEDYLSPVLDIKATYKKPVRYGEKPSITTWVEQYDGLYVTYRYEIYNEENELCVTGESVHVCVRRKNFFPVSIRKHLPEWHHIYEKIKRS